MLELAFATKELRALCEDEVQAAEYYNDRVAKALRNRIADLRAASHPFDLPVRPPRVRIEGGSEHLVIDLLGKHCLVLKCNHPRPPQDSVGAICWHRVGRVQILRIEESCE